MTLAVFAIGLPAAGTAQETWTATSTVGAPTARRYHTAVWTGSKMIIWGGVTVGGGYHNTGAIYDPATDAWTATSTVGAPGARCYHTAVWTGSKMIVWGGYLFGIEGFNTGGIYDPATDTWTATSTVGAPSARYKHKAVWTGSKMIVWGGIPLTTTITGGIYDPATNTWTATSTVGAPSARYDYTAVWTGSKMIVWGGYPFTSTGGIYDPATNTWTATSTVGAPSSRRYHTAVWTGSRMIVWGGGSNTGGIYDPATNTWTATSTVGAPSARDEHTAVWTGSTMIVWGGNAGGGYFNTGGSYDPATNAWTSTSTVGAPSARDEHTAVWTASKMVVWGGYNGSVTVNTGGIYDLSPTPRLSIGDATVTEGKAGTVNAMFTVTLAPASAQIVTVDFATANGSATAPSDYVAALGTLTFTPGQTTRQVTVTVNGDTVVEPDETFFVNLSNATNAIIADGQAVGTITDDDLPGISIPDVTVTEGGTATFAVGLSQPSPLTVSVGYATANGSALVGSDYTQSSGMLTFLPGTITQTLTVAVLDDTTAEPIETFFVNLSNPVNATILDGQGQATVVDDDGLNFLTISPCRLIDTRDPDGPLGGPALVGGSDRVFAILDNCNVPATAKAVSVNLAVTSPTAAGNLRLYPAGTPRPLVSAINYSASQTRANNGIFPLNAAGEIAVYCAQASGTTHFILDVNGYFE